MKTPFDPRHQKREKAVADLFAWGFQSDQTRSELASRVIEHVPQLDNLIVQSAPQWPLEQVNRIDLAILRLALYELVIAKSEPLKVLIDEAVELAKEFGSESSAPFVNGVLGNIVKEKGLK